MMRANSQNLRRAEIGFGLVEVMVAIAIFLVALVGGAALLTTAKQSQYDSYQRTKATQIAHSLVDRIRNNVSQASLYTRALNDPIGRGELGATPTRNCGTVTCDTSQLAAYDLWDVEQLLDGIVTSSSGQDAGGLVLPAACILLDAAADRTNTGRLRVFVSWEDRRATSDGTQALAGSSCGGGATNPYRRQVILDTYLVDPAEL